MQVPLKIAVVFIVTIIIVVVVMVTIYFGQNVSYGISFVKTDKASSGNVSSLLSPSFELIQIVYLQNVNGRIDHIAVDIKNQKLFVAELENNSLDVIDLKEGKRIHSISNDNGLLNEPQSIIFITGLNRIFISNGRDGMINIFDAKSFSYYRKDNEQKDQKELQ
jgi:DNA-binding beta-propeller fold protein YncE